MKGIKMSKSKNANYLQDLMKDLFQPQKNNIHIYLEKIVKSYDQNKRMISVLQGVDKSLFGGKYQSSVLGFPVMTQLDKQIMKETQKIKHKLKEELKGKSETINSTILAMFSQIKDTLDFTLIEQLSQYFNAQIPGTLPQQILTYGTSLYAQFSDLDSTQKTDTDIVKYYTFKLNKYESELKLMNIDLESYISDAVMDENKIKLQLLSISMKMLFSEQKKMFEIMKTPEFDVTQLKEVIAVAITEFKKSLPECDLAFRKLMMSLDTFVDNFDNYYETFSVEGREPFVLFTKFVDDVQSQYSDSDNSECKKLLRQFKKIQAEFATRLGKNMENPVIKSLYEQLTKQIGKATQLCNMEDDLDIGDAVVEETKDEI